MYAFRRATPRPGGKLYSVFVVVNFVQSPFPYMRRYDVSRGRRLGDRGGSQAILFLELLFGTVLGLYAGRLPVANLDWLSG